MRSWYSAAASISSCFLKWAMSSGCVRSSSLVSIVGGSCQLCDCDEEGGRGEERPTFVVEFLKVMNLILILVVTVMTRSRLCPTKAVSKCARSPTVLHIILPNQTPANEPNPIHDPTANAPMIRAHESNNESVSAQLIPAAGIQWPLPTPKSGNLFPSLTQPSIHSCLLIIPSPFLSNISTTIFVISCFLPSSISFAVSSSRPYVRRISRAVHMPLLS